MSLLQHIHRGKRSAPRRVLVYGVHGVGKSTFSTGAPGAIVIPTEDGLAEIDCESFPLATSCAAVMQALATLYAEDHVFKTVVIDSLDWFERLAWIEVCRQRGVTNIEDIPYGRGYVFALTHWRELLEGLDALRKDRGMMVVLTAHCRIERFADPEADSYDRYSPKLHKLASALVQEWSDELLFACYRVFTKQTDEGFNRKAVKGIGSGERILRTTERPSHVAKNRLNLPDELPLDWHTYANYFTQPVSTNGGTNG
jgi:hypothetical protein